MKYWLFLILLALRVGSLASATPASTTPTTATPIELEKVFSKFCDYPGGTMVPSEYIQPSLTYLGINMPSFQGMCWEKQYEVGTDWIDPMYDFITEATSSLPATSLQLAAITGMNRFLVYSDSTGNVFNSKQGNKPVTVLIIWQAIFHAGTIAFYGTMSPDEYRVILAGTLSTNYFGVSLLPIQTEILQFMINAGKIV